MAASIWERLEQPQPGNQPVREIRCPRTRVDYTFVERVRESVLEDSSTFESVEEFGNYLHTIRGSGFEHSWRATGDVPLTPSWLSLSSAAVHIDSGRFVGCGHLTHLAWGLSPAFDLGAIDGRNAFGWNEQGHEGGIWRPADTLYVGSRVTGVVVPLDAGSNFVSVDIHQASSMIGTLDFIGNSAGAVSVYDDEGHRRLLTVIGDISGSESIRFNGDGSWLLVAGSRMTQLVDVATGSWLRVDVGNATWWPTDNSTLLTIEHQKGAATPRLFNLARNEYVRTFPPIELDVPLLSTYPYVWFPAVSPDGTELLAATPAGVTPQYQERHGVGGHLARVTLATGKGRLVEKIFLNPERTLERDVHDVRWTGSPPAMGNTFHPDLAAALADPVTEHEHLLGGRWTSEAERILVATLNRAIALTQEQATAAHLIPEILVSLKEMSGSAEWAQQEVWLVGLVEPLSAKIRAGEFLPSEVTAWTRFIRAVAAARSGHSEAIDTIASAWTLPLPGENVELMGVQPSTQERKNQILALLQGWLDDTDLVSNGVIPPELFCSTTDEALVLMPQVGFLDQVQDFANRSSLMEWASSDLGLPISELPWGRVAEGLQALRLARGWPEISNTD